jgi:hypothetical protein
VRYAQLGASTSSAVQSTENPWPATSSFYVKVVPSSTFEGGFPLEAAMACGPVTEATSHTSSREASVSMAPSCFGPRATAPALQARVSSNDDRYRRGRDLSSHLNAGPRLDSGLDAVAAEVPALPIR